MECIRSLDGIESTTLDDIPFFPQLLIKTRKPSKTQIWRNSSQIVEFGINSDFILIRIDSVLTANSKILGKTSKNCKRDLFLYRYMETGFEPRLTRFISTILRTCSSSSCEEATFSQHSSWDEQSTTPILSLSPRNFTTPSGLVKMSASMSSEGRLTTAKLSDFTFSWIQK